MGTYEKPTLIQPLAAQALAAAGSKMAAAAAQASATITAAYIKNFEKNEKLREEDLKATKDWGRALNEVEETEYTSFELNTKEFLTITGDAKYDLRRRKRLKEGEDGYLTKEEASRQDVLFEDVPVEVSKCNGAVADNMKKYLDIKGKDNQQGGVDLGRTDNEWLVIMKDFDENDGANVSYDYKKGKLYLIYTDPKLSKEKIPDGSGGMKTNPDYDSDYKPTSFDSKKFVRGSLKGNNLINVCGDVSSSVSGLVNGILGRGKKDGKETPGWYDKAAMTESITLEKRDVTDALGSIVQEDFQITAKNYQNEKLFYGYDKNSNTTGSSNDIIGGIYGADWESIYGDEELMKTLWTELQLEGRKGEWKKIEFDPTTKKAKKMTTEKIFDANAGLTAWTGTEDQIELAKSLIPSYVNANRNDFKISDDDRLVLREVQKTQGGSLIKYNNP